jgi:hypothetical protein
MCIAIYKDAKAAPVRRKIFQTCFANNPDGAGYAWWDRKKKLWIVRKGFMSFGAFWKSFNDHGFQKKDTYICHFRIGTSGNRRGPDCTHPFPVVGDCEVMRETEFESPSIVVHNGVHGPGEGTISDTMLAVRKIIWPMYPLLNDKERGDDILAIMAEALKVNSSRWLITEGFEVTLIGDWKKDEESGVRFSNEGWKAPRYSTTPTRARQPAAGSQTRSSSTSTDTVGDFIRCWSEVHKDKYITEKGGLTKVTQFNWMAWNADYDAATQGMDVVEAEFERKAAEAAAPSDDTMVSPNLTCAYSDTPITVQGLVDSNGDVDWEGTYDAASDLLICPNCKEDKYLQDPEQYYTTESESAKAHISDSICLKCGCLFNDDDGTICGFDFELRKEYQKNASIK